MKFQTTIDIFSYIFPEMEIYCHYRIQKLR